MNKNVFLTFSNIILLLCCCYYQANGQTCTCESNFEWMKKTFEENDAGFQYFIDKKGQDAYDYNRKNELYQNCNFFHSKWKKNYTASTV